MKVFNKIIVGWLSPVFILLLLGSGLNAQHLPSKLQNPITAKYLKNNLRKGSPRLVLNKDIERKLKQKLKTDPLVQNVYKGIKQNAEAVFEQSIINLDIPLEERSQNNQLDI
ncbi:hypothetical protein [uncultured Cyclobacterium sp.]|uniref:hypothetical protein n=1 Tax=uncultured Cyclobacterium sp. TaxID=453820 RepID=UPI0030EE9A59|tara:strand:+ start:14721 stop:15056 length:336 start_codon:yes stop_codon:yes gene_type:complete